MAVLFWLKILTRFALADHVTLNFYPTPYGINWNSPGKLARTVILNRLAKESRKIGHVSIEVECGQEKIITGMVQDDNNISFPDMLFKQKYGFGILYYDFRGYMETEKDLSAELERRSAKGNLSLLRIEVNPTTCRRMLDYHKEYQQLGFDQHYGLVNRPRYREGGGCSAFGASFLDVAGVLDPKWVASWNKTIHIPEKYIGGPDSGRKVSFLKIALLYAKDRWARENEPQRKLNFWDPDEMHRWVKTTWNQEKKSPSGDYELFFRGKAKGLKVDRTWVPTPNESFWKE
ncbi:MAG: hypothetical protein KA715_03745 [Xanthomonadaceae bacterium]|nr:hypothetical protein [Xanthomonadaceae bacterium]